MSALSILIFLGGLGALSLGTLARQAWLRAKFVPAPVRVRRR